MNKNILIGLLIIIIVVIGYIAFKPKEVVSPTVTAPTSQTPTTNSQNTNDHQLPISTNILGWKTYINTKYSFGLQYPANFTIDESNEGGFFNELNLYTFSTSAPVDYQKGTDFNVGRITVTVSPTTAKCYSANSTDENMTAIKNINGKSFHYDPKQPMDDSAMGGQVGADSLFSIIENGKCYRIDKLVGYRNRRGFSEPPYPPHFDEQKVNTDLDAIIASLIIS